MKAKVKVKVKEKGEDSSGGCVGVK